MDLKPEHADNYEAGVRSSFLNKRLLVDAAFYTMTIKDKIISQTVDTVTQATEYRNVGKTSHKGFEASIAAAPINMVKLTLCYTYAMNKFEDYTDALKAVNYNGKWMSRSPRQHVNARVTLLPVKGMELEFEADMIGNMYADDANTVAYARPDLYNLRTSYDWRAWQFWVHVMNLADTKYASYVSSSRGSVSYFPGDPRTAYAGAAYKW